MAITMRILHMIPDIGISNGVMSVILNFAKAMPDDIKFDVVYFSQQDKTRQSDIEALGGRVYKIDPPAPVDLMNGKMNRFFEQHKNEWSALHIHCPHFAVFIAPYAKKAGISKIAVHSHTTAYSLEGNDFRNKMLSLYAKYFVKNKFACSEASGRLWFGDKRFTVINNAVDCSKLRYNPSLRSKVRAAMELTDKFVVGHIGKTSIMQKNHPFIFEVFAKIKKQKQNAVLLLAGAEKTEQLEALSKRLGIENDVCYLGPRSDIDSLMQAFDVFLFPSISEGLPVSVVEAQAAGLPVIMSDAVTNEVAATKLVLSKSLADCADSWAQAVLKAAEMQRCDTYDEISLTNWNIEISAKKLVDFYKF